MTTAFFNHTVTPLTDDDLFGANDDLLRYWDLMRLLAWVLRWLRAMLNKKPRKKGIGPMNVPPSLSRDEFGYVDMNGAY